MALLCTGRTILLFLCDGRRSAVTSWEAFVSRSRRVTALDLGTTKVCCVVADVDGSDVSILGMGEVASKGMRKGAVIDIDRAAEAVADAVDAAEQMAGVGIDSAVVGLAGSHIASQNSTGVVAVAGHPEVRANDVSRAVEAARAVSIPSDRAIVHVLPRHFTIDGQDGVREAVGMAGNRLEVEAHIITGAHTAIQNVVKVLHEAGLDVDDVVLQVLASAEAVLDEEERERGVVLVDIGGGTTDVAVFVDGAVLHTAVLPIGGYHVTSDLAVGLRSDLDTAEKIKKTHGHCLQLTVPADVSVPLTPLGYEAEIAVPQRYLAEVIGPRAREMARMIRAQIEVSGPPQRYPGGIVLTGGGALLRGFVDIIQQETDLPTRIATPPIVSGMGREVEGPSHATAIGLLLWGARLNRGTRTSGLRSPSRRSSGQGSVRVGKWLKGLVS